MWQEIVAGSGDDDLSWATALIIDDQPANVSLLEKLLSRMGVGHVVGITDPRQTVEHFRALDPDLVLLDLHMPHLDGVAVLAALGEEGSAESFVPIVVLTADATEQAKKNALSAGATDFLTKPFDQTEVILRVRNLLRTRFLHTTLQRQNADLQSELHRRAEFDRRLAAERSERLQRVRSILDDGTLQMQFQPVIHLSSGSTVGVEALARFPVTPARPPNEWFAEAALIGLGTELELAAVHASLAQLPQLPEPLYLAVNVSPATIVNPILRDAIVPHAERVVVELTEHDAVEGYDRLIRAISELRRAGARLAVDDAGAGYAGLRHILSVNPDIIKLDIALTRGIHNDPARRALAAALVAFAKETGASIVAEGIELAEELETLRQLRVGYGQGFHLGRPAALPSRTGPTPAVA